MSAKLTKQNISVDVPGKIILIGEHSVVYGYPALAMPLSTVKLNMMLCTAESPTWEDAWQIRMQEKTLELTDHFRGLLTKSLQLALKLFHKDLASFTPQKILIDSQIPLGGGMGGSAAVSASLIKLCEKLFAHPLKLEEEIEFANQIDSLFHSGRASGLDVATILSGKFIRFQKGTPFKPLHTPCTFFVALVDSTERAETSAMVKKVADGLESKDPSMQNAILNLGNLASICESALIQGDRTKFVCHLNLAQKFLEELGVSTPKLNLLCQDLIAHGALCAKLTGAGGGGLVLAIFDKNPEFLFNIYEKKRVFITSM